MNEILGAIDIGSNAIRLTIATINTKKRLNILYRERAPLRLGKDAFVEGKFTKKTVDCLVMLFYHFQEIINKYQVKRENFRAVATSAFREAKNGEFVRNLLLDFTGIKIEIISGKEEAKLIYSAFENSWHLGQHPFLLVELGGGSLEFNLIKNKRLLVSESINVGTVRLMNAKDESNQKYEKMVTKAMESIKEVFSKFPTKENLALVGTGGNLRALGKLRKKITKKSSQDFAKIKEVKLILDRVKALSIKKRMEELEINQDRAEVIEGALEIIHGIMTLGNFEKIFLPDLGLIHGIIWQMIRKKNFL